MTLEERIERLERLLGIDARPGAPPLSAELLAAQRRRLVALARAAKRRGKGRGAVRPEVWRRLRREAGLQS